jgi:hypothetical protein
MPTPPFTEGGALPADGKDFLPSSPKAAFLLVAVVGVCFVLTTLFFFFRFLSPLAVGELFSELHTVPIKRSTSTNKGNYLSRSSDGGRLVNAARITAKN